jgi:hypothetical protein
MKGLGDCPLRGTQWEILQWGKNFKNDPRTPEPREKEKTERNPNLFFY